MEAVIQHSPDLRKDSGNFDLVAVTRTEIINIAVCNSSIDQRILNCRPAFLVLNHDEEAQLRHGRYKAPIVRVTGDQYERLDSVLVVFAAGARGESNIDQRLLFFDTLNQVVLDGDVGELFKDLPCCRCVNVIIKNDLIDLAIAVRKRDKNKFSKIIGTELFKGIKTQKGYAKYFYLADDKCILDIE